MRRFSSFLVLALFGLCTALHAQNADATIDQIARAVQASDAPAMQQFLAPQVEVTVPPSTDGEYSQNQALFVLREFFMNYPAQSFAVLVRGNNSGTYYAMGKYVSARQKFDVNLFLRREGAGYVVYQLRFDPAN